MSKLDQLTPEQRSALIEFRKNNGRFWKTELHSGWLRAAFPGPLQQIRNEYGPSWLASLKPSDFVSRNPKTRKRTNPARAKGVALISRKGTAVKSRRANPVAPESTPYHVQEKIGAAWHTLSKCTTAAIAKFLATHYAKHHPTNSFRVVKV
jgi:hypothetical protein